MRIKNVDLINFDIAIASERSLAKKNFAIEKKIKIPSNDS